MKKLLLLLPVLSIGAFASENDVTSKSMLTSCSETKLTELVSILSCPSGDYKVTYGYTSIFNNIPIRSQTEEPKIELLSVAK
jgi:hypothetical protein